MAHGLEHHAVDIVIRLLKECYFNYQVLDNDTVSAALFVTLSSLAAIFTNMTIIQNVLTKINSLMVVDKK